jgi:hypothetical protein
MDPIGSMPTFHEMPSFLFQSKENMPATVSEKKISSSRYLQAQTRTTKFFAMRNRREKCVRTSWPLIHDRDLAQAIVYYPGEGKTGKSRGNQNPNRNR